MIAGTAESTASFSVASERSLKALGADLARAIEENLARRDSLLVGLSGELGAGKTTLVAGALKALGVQSPVTSPTYGLVHPYRVAVADTGEELEVLHVDLYRVESPCELDELGFADEMTAAGDIAGRLLLVEWFENAQGLLGVPDAGIHLRHAAPGRRVRFEAFSRAGRRILARLRQFDSSDPAPGSGRILLK